MKVQHERQEITLDRVSTREELCEVIELINGTDSPAAGKRARRSGDAATDTVTIDMPYELDGDANADDQDDVGEVDELSARLAKLFADGSNALGWIN